MNMQFTLFDLSSFFTNEGSGGVWRLHRHCVSTFKRPRCGWLYCCFTL